MPEPELDSDQVPELGQDRTGDFSPSELARYNRHLLLPEVGSAGQLKLKQSKILIVGAGGLGSPIALYLAAAGVGTIGIIDDDNVDLSNLQRQVIYTKEDIGKSKANSAAARMGALNGDIEIEALHEKLSTANAKQIIAGYDLVIDGTDNFSTRYLVNDACVMLGKPNVYGAIFRFEGQVSLFNPPAGPCYRCLFPQAPPAETIPNCAEGGVLGVLPGIIGTLQATEAIKHILGIGEPLVGRLLLFNCLPMTFDELKIKRDANCALCGDNPTISKLTDEAALCTSETPGKEALSARELSALLSQDNPPLLLDVRRGEEYILGNLPDSVLIPVDELNERLEVLDKDKDIVVYCKSGARSRRAMDMLKAAGFKKVRHLTGGIISWAQEVDPSLGVS